MAYEQLQAENEKLRQKLESYETVIPHGKTADDVKKTGMFLYSIPVLVLVLCQLCLQSTSGEWK